MNADDVFSPGSGVDSRPRPSGSDPPDGKPVYSVDSWDPVIDEIRAAEHPRADELDTIDAHRTDSALPMLDLPGFGDPGDDCGEYIPEAMRWCDSCGDVKQNKHNCVQYDCKMHAPYAIRRRAGGSSSGAGMGPQLDALRRYLNAYRSDNQFFHHIVISPPEDFYLESDRPRERGREIVRTILDTIGVQGAIGYHPWTGDHEDPDANDLGEWKPRLFHRREWDGDVRDELKHRPHWHVVGVAPFVDLSTVGELYDATGWVIARITKEGSNVSIGNDDEMAAALTYVLSHSGIYETGTGQRRLAAEMKGPDVADLWVGEQNAFRIWKKVNAAAEDTLGIPSPSPKCDVEIPARLAAAPARAGARELEPVDRVSEQRREAGGPLASEPLGGWSGPSIATSSSGDPSAIDVASSRGWGKRRRQAVRGSVSAEKQPCGGHTRHISTAGESLLDPEWRDRALFANDLERAYRSYVDVMIAKDLDPLRDGEPRIPEHAPDRPPDD